jgi:hypothetical protein
MLAVSQKWFYRSLMPKADDRFAEHLKEKRPGRNPGLRHFG